MSSQSSTGAKKAVIKYTNSSLSSAYIASDFTIVDCGKGYSVGDSFLLKGTQLGGETPTNDATFTVTSVSSFPVYGITGVSVTGNSGSNSDPFYVTLRYGNTPYPFELVQARDASDIIKMKKQLIMYNEKKTGSPINKDKKNLIVGGRPQVNPAGVNHVPAGNAEVLWQPQGNQFRLSYLFGKVQCGDCSGSAFNLNGPLSSS